MPYVVVVHRRHEQEYYATTLFQHSCSAGITSEQRAKFKKQHSEYVEATGKLDDQLLKLKIQRESLKEGGAKHEDAIMKENARLQVGISFA